MSYDAEVKVPADAQAVIVSPSIVGDRFVQLTPVYEGGDGARRRRRLEQDQTAVPLELDQIYASLDELNVALGPNGANKNGALSDLLETTAENFGGQGAQFHQTIEDFGKLSADPRQQQGRAVRLRRASSRASSAPWPTNDKTVRHFNQSLAQRLDHALRRAAGAARLAAQPGVGAGRGVDLRQGQPRRSSAATSGPQPGRQGAGQAARRPRRDPQLAPLALNNLALTYNPQAGTLDTRSNQGEPPDQIVADPAAFLCGIVGQADDAGGSSAT